MHEEIVDRLRIPPQPLLPPPFIAEIITELVESETGIFAKGSGPNS
jgi:hypothetical protein